MSFLGWYIIVNLETNQPLFFWVCKAKQNKNKEKIISCFFGFTQQKRERNVIWNLEFLFLLPFDSLANKKTIYKLATLCIFCRLFGGYKKKWVLSFFKKKKIEEKERIMQNGVSFLWRGWVLCVCQFQRNKGKVFVCDTGIYY